MMRKLLVSCLGCFLTIVNALAGRDDYGRDYSVRDGDSSFSPIWFFIILAFIGYGAYNAFEKGKDGFSGKGCLASIIAVVIAFIIFSMIVRALK